MAFMDKIHIDMQDIPLSPQFWWKSGSITVRSELSQKLSSMEIQPTTIYTCLISSYQASTFIQSWVNTQSNLPYVMLKSIIHSCPKGCL